METIAALAQARATCAFADDDLVAAARHLAAAEDLARLGATTAVVPMLALHAVVQAAAGAEASPVEAELRGWDNGASRLVGGMLAAAEAVRAGRSCGSTCRHPRRGHLGTAPPRPTRRRPDRPGGRAGARDARSSRATSTLIKHGCSHSPVAGSMA